MALDPQQLLDSGLSLGPVGLANEDPRALLQVLGNVQVAAAQLGSVEAVGSEEVRGEPATRYRTSVGFALGEPAEAPTEVWVGEDGLLRRASYTVTVPDLSETEYLIGYSDFGADAQIVEPPPDDVAPFEEAFPPDGG